MTAVIDAVRISLPWPPSVNGMYLNVKGRGRMKTPAYSKWIVEAGWTIRAQRPRKFTVPVNITIELCPPSRRAFDLDNKNKALLDLLVKHDVIPDDKHQWVRSVLIRIVPEGAPCTVILEAI